MKRMSMFLFAAVAANAILPARGGDSAPFLLDTADGTRIATEGEAIPIAYSPRWGNAASCTVDLGGSQFTATEEGSTTWTPQGTGGHTLTHTAGSTTYTAQFAVLGDDVAVHGTSGTVGTSETWGADKTHLVTAPLTIPAGVSLTIEAGAVVKFMPGASLTVANGGSCTARGVIFTHVNDDTIGGDTLMDGDSAAPKMGDYTITGSVTDDDSTEYRYMPPQTLTSSISSNTRLRGYRTYIVSNSVTVVSGATLTLQPGTILKFNSGCSLTVNGTLDAQGTRAAPIVFTSLKDDAHGGDANGDGEKTYAQAGDWHQITGSGTVKLNYCEVLWCSAQNNQGALYPNGGTWQFDNSIVAHCEYDCMRSYGGTFTANNSVFMDASMGAAPSSGTARFNNCVFNYLTTAVRWGNGTFYNCVFSDISQDIIDTKFYSSTLSSKFYNCCFWNPKSSGDHASAKVGQNGCFYADPLFVDPDNGDFRIAANSPCVDAGDGAVAPELDYWGQPRMDVKRVKDTGTPNGDGVCPDIGIYEVPGAANVPLPDLAVWRAAILAAEPGAAAETAALHSGDTITVTYVVTNRGAAAVSGLVRDLFRFKGADAATAGLTIDAAEIEQAYNVPTGGCVTLSASITVPTLKAGKWKVGVIVNSGRVPYEAVIANNSAEADEVITVAVEPFAAGESKDVEIPAGGVAGAAVAGLPATGGAIVAALPKGVVFYASAGYVPDETQHDAEGVLLADGRTALFIPAHEEGETVYVTLVNDSGTAQTVTLAALASGDGLEAAKPADVAVTAKGPKVTAKLVLPESIRDGRIYAAWVEYSNSGDEDAELPIFTVSRTGGGATLSATAKGTYSASPLSLIGLAPSAPRGKLKPGEAGRVAFYFMSSGNLSLKLGMVTEKSTTALNGFSSVAEYLAGMSAAATRLCARGGAEPGFTEVLAQALNEKRGAGGAAVCGTLRHAVTGEPLTGYSITLVSTNDNSVAAAVTTDSNGSFVLAVSAGGDYTVEASGVQALTTPVWTLAGMDVKGVHLSALPFGAVSGVAFAGDTLETVADAYVTLDDLGTDVQEDYKSASDASGMFKFEGLVDGLYELRLYPKDGWCMVSSGAFAVSNGVALAVNLAYETRGATVRGTLEDIDTGRAVTNAVVAFEVEGFDDALAATPDADGAWVLEGVPAGKYQIAVTGGGWENAVPLEVDVVGDAARIDVKARPQTVFAPKRPVGRVPLETGFHIIRDIADPAWDFDGDGTIDSMEAFPTFTYGVAGTYKATLSYTDAEGVRRTCTHDVEAIEAFENVLSANGIVLTSGGAIQPVSVATNRLVVTGTGAATWTVGMVVGMEKGALGGFVLRLLSVPVADGSGNYVFETEPATLGDLFDEYWAESEFAFTEAEMRRAFAASPMRLMASGDESSSVTKDYPFSISFEKEPVTVTIGGVGMALKHTSDPVAGSQICYKRDGKEVSVVQTRNAYTFTLPVTFEVGKAISANVWKKAGIEGVWNGPGTWGPWGLYFSLDVDYGLDVSFKASGVFSSQVVLSMETVDETTTIGRKIKHRTLNRSFDKPKFEAKSLTGKLSAELDLYCVVGVYASWLKSIGRVGGGLRFGVVAGISQELGIDFTSVSEFLEDHIDTSMKLYTSIYATLQVSAKLLRKNETPKTKADWGDLGSTKNRARLFQSKVSAELPWKVTYDSEVSLGKVGFTATGDGLDVSFVCTNPELEGTGFPLGLLDGTPVGTHGHVWSFGDGGLGSGSSISHTFAEEGEYTVALAAWCDLPSNFFQSMLPFPKVRRQRVKVFDDKPPEPQNTEDTTTKNPKQSCDPNEMDGPDGVGEERYVKPGEWMTYTVYFENKSDADVPAQEVRVTNPLSEWLDWSTFEMCEVTFCNQVETDLAGKQNGTITVDQNDTAYKVQATVALDDKNGAVEWYLRSVDPARAEYNYWPLDGEGLLPPNDETHRGEGHITYRIKVRDDAPANVKIVNSATIVFDYNDPIETEPNWTNTVAQVASVKVNGDVEGEVADLDLIVGMPYGELPTPKARAGYTFGGWYTGSNGTGRRVTAQSLVQAGDSALYAHWLQHAYTVHFEPNGGEGTMSDQAFEFDKEDELDANAFTRKFYLFTGWATNETGEAVFGDSAVVTNLTAIDHSTVTLYATWRYNAVEMSFDAQGGTPVPANSLYELDAPYGELPELTRSGFTFGGWYTGPNGTGRRVTVQDHAQADVTKLYAHWLAHAYTVRFHANGGTGLMSDQAFEFDKPTALDANAFTRQGFAFAGWATNATGVAVYADGVEVRNLTDVDGGVVTLYATWTINSYTVTFDANGGVGGWSSNMVYGAAITAPTVTREGYTFAGWQPVLLGTVPANDVTFTAQWEISEIVKPDPGQEPDPEPVAEETPRLWTEVTGAAPSAATTYDGYLYDASGNVKGTIQVKVGKPNKKTGLAAVKATVIGTDGKKKTLKAAEKGKAQIAGDGPTTVSLAGGDACEVILGAKGMGGTYGAYVIDGSLNVFASKDAADKSVAAGVLGKWKGAVNVAWRLAGDGSPYQTLSVTIAAKGKAKVAGTLADGTKVSAKGQLVVGEEWCCVPVVVAKKAKLAFAVWLPLNEKAAGTAAPHGAAAPVVVGLDDAIAGKPGTLKAGAAFRLGGEMGDATYGAYLPNGVPVTGGAKWTLPKAGKVQQAKDGTVDAAKLGENPSALKLTYKAKDGTFKGSFKAYADVGGKPKGTTVKVTGVLVGGTGYGAATVKGGGGVAVTVE
ncbi:MAG: InlB B-repeat-containing protein [Kiritimatiellae bacterium]|nr:InlB B-repeat-containing protein [Kiritimatiellia bacterium]